MDSKKETLEPFSDVEHKHCWPPSVNVTDCHSDIDHFDADDPDGVIKKYS